MPQQNQVEEAAIAASGITTFNNETEEDDETTSVFSMKSLLWHGGFAWDAWFSCASNQVAQVLLTLSYSSQLGMLSGVILQLFYGFLESWTAYLISILYIEHRTRKEKENVSFKNHVIQLPEIPS
ncbi:unnamed protein product [Musa acuminata subsp. malaccensis]|uniref:(wild Malaysian banana) hypothetical protein n=1 Tax=Musa acuminata subsp. malaccensis TaxID=214687 RepID=A0A804I1L4_MUSAM|nr:unnamed protein product [Musa acuminata subsp. malaccensis]